MKDNGYTTIYMQDLLDYINKQVPLPEKPIMLTFDDGYYNNYLYAYPLAKNMKVKLSFPSAIIRTNLARRTPTTRPIRI